jgi:hypothetical protein
MSLRTLGEHGHLCDEIRARLEVAHRLTFARAALVAGADAGDPAVRYQQLLRGRLREDHRAALLRTLAEPPAELRQRKDQVAVVAHRRRRRNAQRLPLREDVHRLGVHRAVRRQILDPVAILEQAAERPGVDHRAGKQV